MITPSTTVRLIAGVPVSPKHQPYFASATEQTAFFFSKTIANGVFDDFTYQRDNSSIIVPVNADDIYNVNYCMYRNSSYSDKWFYAYVTKVEYVSDYATRLTIETDPFQTWLFDFSMSKCLVEREHTKRYNSDGTPVINLIDEGLDIGEEYVTLKQTHLTPYPEAPYLRWAIITCKGSLRNEAPIVGGASRYAGAISTLEMYALPINLGNLSMPTVNGTEFKQLSETLQLIEASSIWANRIVSVTITSYIPYPLTTLSVDQATGKVSIEVSTLNMDTFAVGNTGVNLCRFITRMTPFNKVLDGGLKYADITKPTESKLLMYPYTYLEVCDYRGNTLEAKLENFNATNIKVDLYGSLGTENYNLYALQNYNNEVTGYTYSIVDNNTDTMPVLNNHTATYLQANANTLQATKLSARENLNLAQAMNVTQSALSVGTGALSMFGLGNVGGGLDIAQGITNGFWGMKQNQMGYDQSMRSLLAQKKDLMRTPKNITSQGTSNYFNLSHNYHGIYLKWKQIKPEYMQRLTEYFKMFGYQVNQIKKPSLKTRQTFNYIKTTGATLTGTLPQNERLDIESMFDNGLFLWHDPNKIGDYDATNEEV